MFEVNKDPDIFFYTGHKHNVKTATHHSVSIHLRSRHTNWHNTLHCAILSNITGTTPSTKLDTSNWKIHKDIKWADEQFDQPGRIDLLIGADLFYEMLLPGRQTHPGNYPVLQETVLGWTLSGRTPTPFTQKEPQHTFLLREDNSLEHKLNRFWEVEPVEQSTMTTEQQACEQHFITHNPTTRWKICCQTSNQYESQATWNFSPLSRVKTCNQTQAGTKSRTQGPVPQLH